MKIGNRTIGDGEPCYIVAEAGINHNGDVNLARELLKSARDAGADAVKFQTFKAKNFLNRNSPQLELFQALELKEDDWSELSSEANKLGITFFTTVFDDESLELMDKLNAPAFKIASGDLNHLPLLRYVASKGRPIILSTGIGTLAEVEEALNVIYSVGNKQVVLLHCLASYPASPEDMNLKAMDTLRQAFKLPVGLSDHTVGLTIPIAAAALGAVIIEKHFTLDKNLPGPDQKLSVDPGELKQMVESVRAIERALGDGTKEPRESELDMKYIVRRSIVSRVRISKGTIITEDMLTFKRPGDGIEPGFSELVVGRHAKVDIDVDHAILWDML